MRHYALHDDEGDVRCIVTRSCGREPATREGLTWTELPSAQHRIRVDGGRCVPALPDPMPEARERAKTQARTENEARCKEAVQRKLESWAREQPDVQAEIEQAQSDLARKCEQIDACECVEDITKILSGDQ